MTKRRYPSIEGLRTIAAMGVVWIHVWARYGNPALKLGGIDFFKAFSFVGNGVDFFFVISGFLMYMNWYDKKVSMQTYFDFIKKRFLRIAPLYYVSLLIYFLFFTIIEKREIGIWDIICNLLFLNTIFKINIVPTYWSLAVEWFFYLAIPLLFLCKFIKQQGLLLLVLSVLGLGRLYYIESQDYIFLSDTHSLSFIPEFGWGIVVGMLYKLRPEKLYPAIGTIGGMFIVLLGRCLRWTSLLPFYGSYAVLCKTLSGTVISLGFAIILLISLNSRAKSNLLLSKPFFQFSGKLSYGIYIWHILFISCLQFISGMRVSNAQLVFYYILVCLGSVALSYISYHTIERYYFKQKRK
jgi:peptidoglycan/LPS O-acetylase OafA/YrhL